MGYIIRYFSYASIAAAAVAVEAAVAALEGQLPAPTRHVTHSNYVLSKMPPNMSLGLSHTKTNIIYNNLTYLIILDLMGGEEWEM